MTLAGLGSLAAGAVLGLLALGMLAAVDRRSRRPEPARPAERAPSLLRRKTAVLAAHNAAARQGGERFGDMLLPEIVEATGEDFAFVFAVLDEAFGLTRR